jgi:hypothetical protein
MAVIGHRQGLATLLTVFFQRDERSLVRRFGARSSPSHAFSPPGFITHFLLPGYTSLQPQIAIQQEKSNSLISLTILPREEYPLICLAQKLIVLNTVHSRRFSLASEKISNGG